MRDLTPNERDSLKRLLAKMQRHLRPQILHHLDIAIIINKKDVELIHRVIEDILQHDLAEKRGSPSKVEP